MKASFPESSRNNAASRFSTSPAGSLDRGSMTLLANAGVCGERFLSLIYTGMAKVWQAVSNYRSITGHLDVGTIDILIMMAI